MINTVSIQQQLHIMLQWAMQARIQAPDMHLLLRHAQQQLVVCVLVHACIAHATAWTHAPLLSMLQRAMQAGNQVLDQRLHSPLQLLGPQALLLVMLQWAMQAGIKTSDVHLLLSMSQQQVAVRGLDQRLHSPVQLLGPCC